MGANSRALRALAAGAGVVMMLAVVPSAARAQGESGVTGRVWGGAVGRYVLKDNDEFDSPDFGTYGLRVAGSAPGFGADIELRPSRWIGLDGAVGYSNLNVQFTTSTAPGTVQTQRFSLVPVMVDLDLHLIHARALDLWVGPQVAYVIFPHDLTYTVPAGTFAYTSKNVFSAKGFVVGSDIRLARSLALTLGFRWQDADGDSDGHLTIDPTFVTIGLATHF